MQFNPKIDSMISYLVRDLEKLFMYNSTEDGILNKKRVQIFGLKKLDYGSIALVSAGNTNEEFDR